jgi:hypothetical protein
LPTRGDSDHLLQADQLQAQEAAASERDNDVWDNPFTVEDLSAVLNGGPP